MKEQIKIKQTEKQMTLGLQEELEDVSEEELEEGVPIMQKGKPSSLWGADVTVYHLLLIIPQAPLCKEA